MANFVEKTKINPKKFVSASSRYATATVMYYTERKLLTFSTYKKQNIPLSKNDKYTVITAGTEYRPDLMSQTAYGTPDFWWKIMEANGIKDVFEFKAGLNIRLPNAIY